METRPQDINALQQLLDHPERFPDYHPHLINLLKQSIANTIRNAHPAAAAGTNATTALPSGPNLRTEASQ